MITVMAATGRTGRRIVEQLLRAGVAMRALGRSAEKLAPLQRLGADVRAGDPTDVAYLTDAFRGSRAVYTLLPYELGVEDYNAAQARQGAAIVDAIDASGVTYVVALGSLGSDLTEGTGPILTMRAQEERLRRLSGVNVLSLRAGAFMDNIGMMLPYIEQEGANADAFAPDYKIPMIASQDIADAAAQALLVRDWIGFQIRELLGERDLSYAEATRIIGERIGRPDLPYVQLSDDDALALLPQAGFSPDLAKLYIELAHTISAGRVRSLEGRNARNTTPTSFEQYVDELLAQRA